ncbi:TPA: ead/Ea22-like family protein [Escherichia coli]|nr:ead/Ea22-like family protein [Escherichia coli]
MSEINYQALREAAQNAKDLGEIKNYKRGEQAVAEFESLITPHIVLALLDERERNQQYIKHRDQENEEIALTVGRLLIENGQLVADTLRHLADNEIDSDYFAITSTNENGTEIDHEMAITDYALQAAGTVDELVAALESAEKRIAELEAEPVSQTYNLPELIEGMEVSIDVSTCDADLGNRYFGTVTEALELDTAKNGYILLVQDAEPNFDVNGSSPVIPDGWVIVPKKLTAENGAKGVLSGEFSETTFISCPECFGDDDCDTCDGSGRIEIKVPVTWTTIKSIWDKGIAHFAAKPTQEVNRG